MSEDRRGREFWRSIEELADGEASRRRLGELAPRHAETLLAAVDRRQFLKLMGASLALAGLTGCTRQPREEIVPYVRQPEHFVPGRPLYFATAVLLGGFAAPVLAESHMGRPTKLEGNPDHPASLGATDALTQAAVLTLYDPDRSQVVLQGAEIRPWGAFVAALRGTLEGLREQQGEGLRILTETITSPSLAGRLREVLAEFPNARWHQWEPVNRDNVYAGARLAFGEAVDTIYDLGEADVVLSLDADFLSCGPGHVRYVRDFARRRRAEEGGAMNRLYVVESTPTNTGAMADHRWPAPAARIAGIAAALAGRLGFGGPASRGSAEPWLDAVARDLQAHRGRCLVIAGDEQPPAVHALAHAMNHLLGNVGRTVRHVEPVVADAASQTDSLRELVADMNAGRVSTLLVLGGNPVYDAPADVPFAEALATVGLSVHLSLYEDETSSHCRWHVPAAHPLESWGDARAYDGMTTLLQPLIDPLYGGKTAYEILALFGEKPDAKPYDLVREYWRGKLPGEFERAWRKALHDGVVPDTAAAVKAVSLRGDLTSLELGAAAPGALELIFRPDPTIFDGRFANNGWLQELPKPHTRLTWDNAALVSPSLARRLGLESGEVVELSHSGRKLRAAAWIAPGQPADSITLHLGYGRTRAGRVGNDTGFNAYALRTSTQPWFASGVEIRRTGERYPLAVTQEHHSMEGRDLVRETLHGRHAAHPAGAAHGEGGHAPLTLYPAEHDYPDYAWGMAIDLAACTGCNACVTACQAENNVAVVGKDEVARGHEMLWLRIDRYFAGDEDNPRTLHQPVPCMHCENAPCEVVCPVGATVHSSEGLNDMVYNRCVGTKYCSNNCPYKVRRFNWFKYSEWDTESLKLLYNPDVTVRSRGVMEKCTYCVQRINAARIEAEKENRPIRDGEVRTACQQVCPAEAIVFGNVNDPRSRVAQLKKDPRNYALLGELNTGPRTTYLARVRNPNPELSSDRPAGYGG